VSNAFAIAGVTRVLRQLLNDGLIEAGISGLLSSTVEVTTLPPDRVPTSASGAEVTCLNVFLRHVSPNLGWRNEGLASVDATGRTRLSNPPLALDLHYLVSAHAPQELHAEILLGHAMLLLHQTPIVPRLSIRSALNPSGVTLLPPLNKLGSCGLEDQLEQLKITPEHLGSEELSKFWSATLSHYRQCAGYHVSVVLLQASEPTHKPLPVLERRGNVEPDLAFSFPTLDAVKSNDGQHAVTVGTPIKLEGRDLGAAGGRTAVIVNERLVLERTMTEVPGTGNERELELLLPDTPDDFPVGLYRVAVLAPTADGTVPTNQLAFVLAPKLTSFGTITRAGDLTTIPVNFLPRLRTGQDARIVIGQREQVPDSFTGEVSSLTFTVSRLDPGSSHLVRLRIDGIDTSILDLSDPKKPTFDNSKRIVIP
jgi:Pvc16 N-terminal domain